MFVGLEKFKLTADARDIDRSLPELFENKAILGFVWPSTQSSNSQLRLSKGFGLSIRAEANVTWVAQILLAKAPELTRFLQAKRAFELELLNGNREAALGQLDSIDAKLGLCLRFLPPGSAMSSPRTFKASVTLDF